MTMRMYRRIGVAAVTGVAALSLAACAFDGSPGDRAGAGAVTGADAGAGLTAVEVSADLSAEGQALAALGFSPGDIEPAGYPATEPTPSAGAEERAKPGPRKRHLNRVLLRRNTLHGEVVVQTKEGTKTLLVQRGEVTAIDDTTITVKSADGYTQTWRFGDKIRVVERRATVQPKEIEVGTKVGIAGIKDGEQNQAKLIVVPAK
jgi:hypothetical protein